jgi:tRNA-2-methylthio-N6-dimethylallyladenosine synthase
MASHPFTDAPKPSLKLGKNRTGLVSYQSFTFNPQYQNLGEGLSYHLLTFGCQGNLADSETIRGLMANASFTETPQENEAKVLILNTCAVRATAEDRVWGELGRLKHFVEKNHAIIVFAGCMSQEEKTIQTIKEHYPYVQVILGTHNLVHLIDYLGQAMERHERVLSVFSYEGTVYDQVPKLRESTFKAYVEIMFGCDEFCTYCIVPYTRGKARSRRKEDILQEISTLVTQGYLEVTLLGQNVNGYGLDLYDQYSFGDLLQDCAQTGIKRLRFTTSHPNALDLKTIEVMRDYPAVMPHFHLPVQSGSDAVLQLMKRGYTVKEYLDKIALLKQNIPHLAITTDLIVGFPMESEDDFLQTLDLVRTVGFDGAFTFIYNQREGTPAVLFRHQIPQAVKKERLTRLLAVVNEMALIKHQAQVGKVVEILVEGPAKKKGMLRGYTPDYKLVNFTSSTIQPGQLIKVKIQTANTWFLTGVVA